MVGVGDLHLPCNGARLHQGRHHLATGAPRPLEILAAPGDKEWHSISRDIDDRARGCCVLGTREKAVGILRDSAIVEGGAHWRASAHRAFPKAMTRPKVAPQARKRREMTTRGVAADE